MKILLLDIETAPNEVFVWDGAMWKQNIGSDMVRETSRILCWAAKWYGDKHVYFGAEWKDGGQEFMLAQIHALLCEADVVVHYNGTRFDIPKLNQEFLKAGMGPPSPYKQIDLYQIVKRNFRFIYNKLAWVLKELNLGAKLKHTGFQMWVDCMEGDPKAQALMEKYNKGDVIPLERLYDRLRPWIKTHPVHGAYKDGEVCPKCGSSHLHSRGYVVAKMLKYVRYQCQECGGWSRSNKAVNTTGKKVTNI